MDDNTSHILTEIKQMLSSSSSVTSLSSSSLKKTKSTPSMVNSPYDVMNSTMRRKLEKEAKKMKAAKARLKAEPSNDELLSWYATQPKHNLGVSSDDIIIKNKNIPYADTIIKIEEKLKVVDYTEEKKQLNQSFNTIIIDNTDEVNDINIDNKKTGTTISINATTQGINFTVKSLRRRYARLLENIHLDESMFDTSKLRIKSDVWLAKWIEECYDEAYKECSNYVRESRRKIRCGLELGSMDSFPSAVMRFLTRTYSVMELRIRTCVEILYSLEKQIQLGSSYEISDSNELMFNGGRALLFTKFLSEEYDLQYLAIFLECREVLQKQLYIKLKDLNPMRVWTEINNDGNDSSVKVAPIKLPALLKHIPDVTMPEAPLVGFDTGLLPSLCNAILSNSSLKHRAYLMDTVLNKTKLLIKDGMNRNGIFPDINTINSRGIEIEGSFVTPIYTLLLALLDQWTQVPSGIKDTFGKLGEASSSLRMLNIIYDNDCEMRKILDQDILSVDAELTNAIAVVTKLEKSERRLARKWKEGTATEEELQSLPTLRVKIEDAKTYQMEVEAKSSRLAKEQNKLANKTEELWTAASSSIQDEVEEASKRALIKKKTWRDAAMDLLSDALTYNENLVSALIATKVKGTVEVQPESDELEPELQPFTIELESQMVVDPADDDDDDDITKLIKALEAESSALAAIGSDEALDIGIVPVIVKDKLLQQLEEENKIREMNINIMKLELELMNVEDQKSKEFSIEFKKQSELKMKIEVIAKIEIDALMSNAVKEISEATLLKRLDEMIFIQNLEEEKLRKQAEIAAKSILIVATAEVQSVINTASDIAITTFIRKAEQEALFALLEKEEERKKNLIHVVKTITDQFVYKNIAIVTENTLQKIIEEEKVLQSYKDELTRDFIIEAISHYSDEGLNRAKCTINTNQVITNVISNLENILIDDVIDIYNNNLATVSQIVLSNILNEIVDSNLLDIVASAIVENTDTNTTAIYQIIIEETVVDISKSLVSLENGDSWNLLDLDPESWLKEEVIYEVEERFMMCRMLQYIAMKKNAFKKLLRDVKLRKLTIKTETKVKRNVLTYMMNIRSFVMIKVKAAITIQSFAKLIRDREKRRINASYLSGLRKKAIDFERSQLMLFAKYLMVDWKYRAYTNSKTRTVKFALKERRMMICYFTWKLQFRIFKEKRLIKEAHEREKAIIIQCIGRRYNAKKRCAKLAQQVLIIRALKLYIARNRLRKMKQYRRLQNERYYHVRHKFEVRELRKPWANWRRCTRFVTGFSKAQYCVNKKKMKKRFIKWKLKCQSAMAVRHKHALKLQKTIRMWIIKRYVLDYYRWNRALRKMQGLVRRRQVAAYFEYAIYYYRRAKLIQKVYRGYRVRTHITEKRISDLHYAAYHNNYDRLEYYVKKFPELITELDSDGNTALHNAARSAARRTLKLLMRQKLDPNALNLAGYSALHLTIMSTAINRDDCCLYMLDRGFDEEQFTPDGKSCLLLAVDYGRGIIVKQLLKNGLDPNIADHSGTTCLQSACRQGFIAIVNELIEHGADVNAPGYCGTYPLHDCLATGNIEIANLLFRHGAYVNVKEPYQNQTPLMWACYAGLAEFAMLYLEQGANVYARDHLGWTAVHHGACSNSASTYNVLRMSDANFEEVDDNGNYPLHIATSKSSYEFVRCLLEGLCNPCVVDVDGNEACHLAARDDNVELLVLIGKYDDSMARENYHHQTPLGVAKYHNARRAVKLLNEMYGVFEQDAVRNSIGEIWWDKEIDEKFDGWHVIITPTGERSYFNEITGETSSEPPPMSAALVLKLAENNRQPVRKLVTINKDDNLTTKHGYLHEHKEMTKEIHHMSSGARSATIIGKWMRRKLAYKELKLLKKQKKMKRILARFIKKYNYRFKLWKHSLKVAGVVRIQKRIRGFLRRSKLYWTAEYNQRWDTRNRLRLRLRLWRLWLKWRGKKVLKVMKLKKNPPKTLGDWQIIIDEARFPKRKVGAYEEYVYPGEKRVYFYRHATHGECTFDKPKKMELHDRRAYFESKEIRTYGCTLKQKALATKLQAIWRGYSIRSYYELVERAMEISTNAEAKYMENPDSDVNLYNHALHCFAILGDYARARALYIEALRRMEYRGPDIAFILYSYCVFAFVTHDQDYSDILMLLERARKAEEIRENQIRKAAGLLESLAVERGTFTHGKIFELANVGFFRYAANSLDTSQAWHSYAACRFIIFNHFNSSFDAFLNAFKHNPRDKLLRANFDIMMEHFHGKDKDDQAAVVRNRMRILAEKDEIIANERQARREEAANRDIAARKIQGFLKACRSRYAFKMFMDANKMLRERINKEKHHRR